MTRNCVVPGCTNTYANTSDSKSKVHFYTFPSKKRWFDIERKQAWIRFVSRKNLDGSEWQPSSTSLICSDHFYNNEKVNIRGHPSYNPTIHPLKSKTKTVKSGDLLRFERCVNRNIQKDKINNKEKEKVAQMDLNKPQPEPMFKDQFIQTEQPMVPLEAYVEMQEKFNQLNLEHIKLKKELDQLKKEIMLKEEKDKKTVKFRGYDSVSNNNNNKKEEEKEDDDEKMQQFVSIFNFHFNELLCMLQDFNPRSLRREDYLLAFLFKLKTGLSFPIITILFNVSSSTLNLNFYIVLDKLYQRMQKLISWPTREKVQTSMSDCFKRNFPNCRVIIYCVEVEVEKPSSVDAQYMMYSNHRSTYTVKYLIGIAPCGTVVFVSSQAFGGGISDCDIINQSGILNLLQPGDIILADQSSFPTLTNTDVITVLPPVDKQDNNRPMMSSKISSLRSHMERSIMRLKIYKILNNCFPQSLLPKVNNIIYVCAALVNLQAPIIKSAVDDDQNQDDGDHQERTEFFENEEEKM